MLLGRCLFDAKNEGAGTLVFILDVIYSKNMVLHYQSFQHVSLHAFRFYFLNFKHFSCQPCTFCISSPFPLTISALIKGVCQLPRLSTVEPFFFSTQPLSTMPTSHAQKLQWGFKLCILHSLHLASWASPTRRQFWKQVASATNRTWRIDFQIYLRCRTRVRIRANASKSRYTPEVYSTQLISAFRQIR